MGIADTGGIGRRAFVAGMAAGAAVVAVGCGGDDDGAGDDASAKSTTTTTAAAVTGAALPGGLAPADVPSRETIFGWIDEVFGHGVRRPGYEADIWAEEFIADTFREIGLENVRLEPVDLNRWEPREWSLEVVPSDGDSRTLDCFPLPYSLPIDGLEVELVALAPGVDVTGKASLSEEALIRVPPTTFVGNENPDERIVDAEGTFEDATHIVPFGPKLQAVMDDAIAGGAAAFVGALTDYPGDSYQYFVPYDGEERPIPGVWISGSDGAWVKEQLAAGPVRIRLTVDSISEPFQSHNVVGELPGADDEVVMVASHHDGPWASAVEDGSGISMVLAQATFWAAQPRERRPHKMVFLLQGGHMHGGAGLHRYIEDHRAELDNVVLELHLEHAALEFEERDGELVSTEQCVPRWWFVSRNPDLEGAVRDALVEEKLNRSMILRPDAIGDQPPTDGAFYHSEGVPIVHFLAAPFYLFDEMDRLDKIDQESLVPITRATIRILESTAGISAAEMRAGVVEA